MDSPDIQELPENLRDERKKELKKGIELVKALKTFSENKGFPFDFVIISSKQFDTGFNKEAFPKIQILLEDGEPKELEKLINIFDSKTPRKNFFYFFVKPESLDKFNLNEFVRHLCNFAVNNYYKPAT